MLEIFSKERLPDIDLWHVHIIDPLVTMFNPAMGTPTIAANRLAQWVLTLCHYEYTMDYRSTKDHGNAYV